MSRGLVGLGIFTVGSVAWLATAGAPMHIALPWATGLVLACAVAGWWRYGRNASRVVRAGERTRRKHGVASTSDIIRRGSAYAVRRRGTTVRPSLAALSWWTRLRLPTNEVGLLLGKASGIKIWASVEDAIAVFGGPRFGKTGWLAGRIIDAPGAVFCTSTRLDLKRLTEPHRARAGLVLTYNPAGYGGDEDGKPEENTLAFDPLTGCDDPQCAVETAEDMIPKGFGETEAWREQARRVLAVLLHAAALEPGLTMRTVADWAADPDGWAPSIRSALQRSPERGAFLTAAKQFTETNPRTRTSITSSIMPALAWLSSPTAVASLDTGTQLDVPTMIRGRATVYLIGREEAHTSGLTSALTGRIIRATRLYATRQPGGRCDPPPSIFLDEAARVAKIDLANFSGDCGGNGITLVVVFQSRSDMADVWGPHGSARIITNCGQRLLFGGTADAAELKAWSELAGSRDETAKNYDAGGKSTGHGTRKVPVLDNSVLANPGEGRAVIFHRTMPPVIAKMRMAWRRPDVRNTLRWRLVGERVSRWREQPLPELSRRSPAYSPTHPPAPGFTHPVPGTTQEPPTDHELWKDMA